VACQDTGIPLTVVSINTDQSQCFRLQGTWSTAPNVWVDEVGDWATIPPNSLPSTIPVPSTQTGTWQFDPTAPDTAVLRVSVPGNSTVFVDAQVYVAPAPPRTLELKLLTNSDSCYAGKPILIGSYIRNLDGPVPGYYTAPSTYTDMLINSLRATLPWLSVNPQLWIPSPDSSTKHG
jgi:hypothetical protein